MRAAKLDVAQIYGGAVPTGTPRLAKLIRVAGAVAPRSRLAKRLFLDGAGNGIAFDWKRSARRGGKSDHRRRTRRIQCSAKRFASPNPGEWMPARVWKSRRESKDHEKVRQFVSSRAGNIMMTSQPDSTGHFGPYGGRFVPEVLMAPLEELEHAYREASRRSGVSGGAGRSAEELRRPSDAALLREASERNAGRREDLSQARRSAAHRRAQNQQLPGPGAARAAHGQEAHHRRDRRGPARRRDRHRLRAVRPGVHRLHGRRGHAPAAPERLPHAPAGREGGAA